MSGVDVTRFKMQFQIQNRAILANQRAFIQADSKGVLSVGGSYLSDSAVNLITLSPVLNITRVVLNITVFCPNVVPVCQEWLRAICPS